MARIFALAGLLLALCVGCAQAADRYFVTTDGVRLHYTDQGHGNVLVFVPGWTMPGWIFAPQIAAFSQHYRVIAFDPRGQGLSEVAPDGYNQARRGDDIGELIAQLHVHQVVLVGWSLGVLDTLAYIHVHGDDAIAGLVLIDNSVGENPPPRPYHGAPHGYLPWNQRMRFFVAGMFDTPQPSAYIDRLTESCLRLPQRYARRLLAYPVPRSYWRAAIYSTDKPILYIVRPHLAGQAANLQLKHPDAQSVILDDVGHALFVDNPQQFNTLLATFLREKLGW
jgi:non-heme chloroperoxidase